MYRKAVLMHFTPTNSEVYYGISYNNYLKFHDFTKELKLMCDKYNNFQVLDHTPDEVQNYHFLDSQCREALFITIVFQAFAIEAFVNLVAVNLYKEEEFFGVFEKKSTTKKIRKIFGDKLNSSYDKFTKEKDLVDLTFMLRYQLAHYKSKNIDLEEMQSNPYSYNPYEDVIPIYDNIDEIIEAYPSFKALVYNELGYDLFKKQEENLMQSVEFNIKEMFKKGFGIEY